MSAGEADLLALGDSVLAGAQPGEAVEVAVAHSVDTEVRVHEGEVESLSSATSQGVGIRVVRDGRQGFAWAGTFDPEVLAQTLVEARDNATFGTLDEHLGLASPDGVEAAPLDLWDPRLEATPTADKVSLALDLERAVLGADPRITGLESTEYVDSRSTSAVVTTTGIRAGSRETVCYLASYVLAGGGEETQTGFGYSLGRAPGDLDVEEVARDAARRATRMLGAVKPPSGRMPVILDPWVTAQVLEVIGSTLLGDVVLKGRSPFAGRLGEVVASPVLTLVDDPTDPTAFTATPLDGEGLATRRNPLITDGRLDRFLYDTTTSRRAGTTPTGSAVRSGYSSTPGVGYHALRPEPGGHSAEELLAQVGDGILIQDVAGLHSGVNPVSGDLSTGAEGLRIRGGELAEPLREFTVATTLQRLVADVAAVGADLVPMPMSAAGVSLLVADVTVSGT